MTRLHSGFRLNGAYQLMRQLGQGGFGETWEIKVGEEPKVLKILLEDFPKAIELFQREANVLGQLTHPGIPETETDSYFCCTVEGFSEPIHGYVMEKISGITLSDWMKARDYQPIGRRQMLQWVTQLAEILAYLHSNGFYHRDIKPSNIMLKDDGQLVLIDFGGVKEVTQTQLQNQLGDRTGTRLSTQGYTPAEQIDGSSVQQSDFFALGRTCTYLLTGQSPTKFQIASGKLLWQEAAPNTHTVLASFIDELMAPFPDQRPRQAQDILARLPYIQRVLDKAEPVADKQRSFFQRLVAFWHAPSVVPVPIRFMLFGIGSVSVSVLILFLRAIAVLQPLELAAYDQLLLLRPAERPDDRIVVITANDEDRVFQSEVLQLPFRGEWQSISDSALVQMMDILSKAEPQTIGLDIYLDYLRDDDDGESLAKTLKTYPRLTTLCLAGNNAPPSMPEADSARLGFSNFARDNNNRMVRRHFLLNNFPPSVCTAIYAFSLLLADQYLESKGVTAELKDDGLQYNDVVLKGMALPAGGYRKQVIDGDQILLNYRSLPDPVDIGLHLSLKDVLTENFDPELLKDRIVLIGIDTNGEDDWLTPGGVSTLGVFVHAHMVSQLLSAVLDQRPLIFSLHERSEKIIIVVFALLGGGIAILGTRSQLKVLIYLFSLFGLIVLSLILLIEGMWFPVVPAAMGLTGSYALTTLCTQSKLRKKLFKSGF